MEKIEKFTLMLCVILTSCVENYDEPKEYQWEDECVLEQAQPTYVTVTRYQPVKEQCNNDPLTTADGSKISLKKLRRGEIKWVAVSRDLLEKYSFGDIITIESGDDSIDGDYEIHDVMNKRFTNRIDILTPIDADLGKGKWDDVVIW